MRNRPLAPSALEYAPAGLIGVLTPQANTTVEPEFSIMLPAGFAMISARLTSPDADLNDRLRQYWADTPGSLDQFANAPLAAVAYGCTGASYLAGKDDEDALVAEIERARGYPFVTSATAVTDALMALEASSIGLVSPYPDDLTQASVGYWESRGFGVDEIASAYNAGSDFHPIYSIAAGSAADALAQLREKPVDAIVMLGTGMPTLGPIAAAAGWNGPPVISCMLALGWRSVLAARGTAPAKENLMPWIGGVGWSARLPV